MTENVAKDNEEVLLYFYKGDFLTKDITKSTKGTKMQSFSNSYQM